MTKGMSQTVKNYGRVWDADAPEGLVDQIFAPDVVDHNPQPGQGLARARAARGSSRCSICIALLFPTSA